MTTATGPPTATTPTARHPRCAASPASLTFVAIEGETLAIVVEGVVAGADAEARFSVSIGRPENNEARCGNERDDDLDGSMDCDDRDCASTSVCGGSGSDCMSVADCPPDAVCSRGFCTCTSGRRCGDLCIDTSEDFFNCGDCGNACRPGQACEGSVCVDAAEACDCPTLTTEYCRPGEGRCTDPEGCCGGRFTFCTALFVECSET